MHDDMACSMRVRLFDSRRCHVGDQTLPFCKRK
jgi:hypothetical protein